MNDIRKITNELYSNEMTRLCCEFYAQHGRLPKANATDPHELMLARWITNRRRAKLKAISCQFYESDEKIAESKGLPDLFHSVPRAPATGPKPTMELLCAFIAEKGRNPSPAASCRQERRLAYFLYNRRRRLKKGFLAESEAQTLNAAGLSTVLRNVGQETLSNDRCRRCCKFIKRHGRFPRLQGKEAEIGKWLHYRRCGVAGTMPRVKIYDSDLRIAEIHGLPDLFSRGCDPSAMGVTTSRERKSNELCRLTCQFVSEHGRLPLKHEREHAPIRTWFSSRRVARRLGTFYQSDLRIAKRYGLPGLFKMKLSHAKSTKRGLKSMDMVRSLVEFVLANRRLPTTTGNEEERELKRFLSMKSLAMRGKNSCKFYRLDQKTAEEAGLPTLFYRMPNVAQVRQIVKFVQRNGCEPSLQGASAHERTLAKTLAKERAKREGKHIVFDQLFALCESLGMPNLFKVREITAA